MANQPAEIRIVGDAEVGVLGDLLGLVAANGVASDG